MTTPPSDERKAEEAVRAINAANWHLSGCHVQYDRGQCDVCVMARALLAQHDLRAKERAVVERAKAWRVMFDDSFFGDDTRMYQVDIDLAAAVDALEGT